MVQYEHSRMKRWHLKLRKIIINLNRWFNVLRSEAATSSKYPHHQKTVSSITIKSFRIRVTCLCSRENIVLITNDIKDIFLYVLDDGEKNYDVEYFFGRSFRMALKILKFSMKVKLMTWLVDRSLISSIVSSLTSPVLKKRDCIVLLRKVWWLERIFVFETPMH